MNNWLASMGEPLLVPPNVRGFLTGTNWINSETLLARQSTANQLSKLWQETNKEDPIMLDYNGRTNDSTCKFEGFTDPRNEFAIGVPPMLKPLTFPKEYTRAMTSKVTIANFLKDCTTQWSDFETQEIQHIMSDPAYYIK
jgi:hypothetical protein